MHFAEHGLCDPARNERVLLRPIDQAFGEACLFTEEMKGLMDSKHTLWLSQTPPICLKCKDDLTRQHYWLGVFGGELEDIFDYRLKHAANQYGPTFLGKEGGGNQRKARDSRPHPLPYKEVSWPPN